MAKFRVFEKINEETGEAVQVELTNEIQISAFVNEGFKEVTEEEPKKKK